MTDDRIKKINAIIDKFNFHKVLIAMQALDWCWVQDGTGQMVVPTISELKAKARHLLQRSISGHFIGAGGFEARYHPSVDGDPEWFELRFIVEDVESFDDDD